MSDKNHYKEKSPCSDKEINFPLLKAHCPSTLPVVENAQQDPQLPYNIIIIIIIIIFGV